MIKFVDGEVIVVLYARHGIGIILTKYIQWVLVDLDKAHFSSIIPYCNLLFFVCLSIRSVFG